MIQASNQPDNWNKKKTLFVCMFCSEQHESVICFLDMYDATVISGGMGEGHIPCEGMKELIRITKPGKGC